ncbi:serine hydrolase domain-containing protein [Paenibacillaceae bacterium WGS1546]|uniref:serine hydrolase domain-containing protein n=1 Tax=Cohnella sp. WGS1546 TaxID=3366810 RepID=UPI00372D33C0
MKSRKPFRLLSMTLALSMLVPTGAMAASSSGESPAYEETIAAASEKAELLTGQYGTTSVQYALIDQGKIVVSGQSGINDQAGKKPLTESTMYGIGSTSKMFAAASVMKLVDEGKVDLDTPVVQYVPDFTMQDERYKQITPRMLLNHSAGLPGSSLANAFLFEDNDTYAHDTLLEQLAGQKLKADPGAYSVYCNDCFTLAEILVERVADTDFTSYIHRHFTGPLGMSDTKTPLDRVNVSAMAGLYYPTIKNQLPNETVNAIGTGGIYSTAEDLVRFSQIFTGRAEGILSDESATAMAQAEYRNGLWPEDANTSVNYGLGWDSVNLFPFGEYDIQALTKGGDTILYHASLVVLPEKDMAAAVLSSGGSSATNQLLATEILLHALKEKGEISEFKAEKSYGKPVNADMPEEWLNYAGMYGSTNQLMRADISEDGELSITTPQVPEYPAEMYTYSADGSFMNADGSAKINFVEEENGRTYLWVRQYVSLPGLGQLALSQYSAEKLEPHAASDEALAAWKERDGKHYYYINEKYTSLSYLLASSMQIQLFEEAPGYVLDRKITGPDTASSDLQVPVTGSRDAMAYDFYRQDGIEYLRLGGSLFVSEEALKPIYSGKSSSATIPASGYAKWYTIPDRAAGKTMTVTLPSEGSYAVYDENGTFVDFSVVSPDNTTVLPQGGTIVFAGEAGSKFEITMK